MGDVAGPPGGWINFLLPDTSSDLYSLTAAAITAGALIFTVFVLYLDKIYARHRLVVTILDFEFTLDNAIRIKCLLTNAGNRDLAVLAVQPGAAGEASFMGSTIPRKLDSAITPLPMVLHRGAVHYLELNYDCPPDNVFRQLLGRPDGQGDRIVDWSVLVEVSDSFGDVELDTRRFKVWRQTTTREKHTNGESIGPIMSGVTVFDTVHWFGWLRKRPQEESRERHQAQILRH